jgi:hypothetical protein
MSDRNSYTLKFTREQLDAMIGWSYADHVGFVYGGTADSNDAGVQAQRLLLESRGMEVV